MQSKPMGMTQSAVSLKKKLQAASEQNKVAKMNIELWKRKHEAQIMKMKAHHDGMKMAEKKQKMMEAMQGMQGAAQPQGGM